MGLDNTASLFYFHAQAETVHWTVSLPKARIILNRFHIIQHLRRAMMTTRIAIMKSFDKKPLPYRASYEESLADSPQGQPQAL